MNLNKTAIEFTNRLTAGRFHAQADRKKMLKKEYRYDILGTYFHGPMDLCEHIFERYKNKEYDSIEELIGDLHIIYTEAHEYMKKNVPMSPKAKMMLSDFGFKDVLELTE